MLTEQNPVNGAVFSRPGLTTVCHGLETLCNDGQQNGKVITPAQCLWFNRCATAWAEYRDSQPEHLRSKVDKAIAVILGYEVKAISL